MADRGNMTDRGVSTEIIWKDRKHIMWFPWTFTKYSITNDRLMIEQGLLRTVVDETLLYRIVDITMEQTLLGKLFGTGTLCITAKVDKTPELHVKNIAKPREVRTLISQLVEESRQRRNVVGKEFFGGPGPRPMHENGMGDPMDDLFDGDL